MKMYIVLGVDGVKTDGVVTSIIPFAIERFLTDSCSPFESVMVAFGILFNETAIVVLYGTVTFAIVKFTGALLRRVAVNGLKKRDAVNIVGAASCIWAKNRVDVGTGLERFSSAIPSLLKWSASDREEKVTTICCAKASCIGIPEYESSWNQLHGVGIRTYRGAERFHHERWLFRWRHRVERDTG